MTGLRTVGDHETDPLGDHITVALMRLNSFDPELRRPGAAVRERRQRAGSARSTLRLRQHT
jgi:hypothetical protein